MKKWLDDLYAILLKRGFKTLDNVLKKYKTQIEDYEEIKINNDIIILSSNESVTIDLSGYYNLYDRYVLYNRGFDTWHNFICYFYNFDNNKCNRYSTINTASTVYEITFSNDRYLIIKNITNIDVKLDIYIKKIC